MEAPLFDAVVVGGGPAGAATAAHLARRGRSVMLLEGARSGTPVGDHLPGEARGALARLGAWDRFLETRPLESRGVESAWGVHEPGFKPGLMEPYGGGWHVDRRLFDKALRVHAERAGALRARGGRARSVRRDDGHWSVVYTRGGSSSATRARWLIDATGRRAWLSRRLGCLPEVADALHGFVRYWDRAPVEPHVLVEALDEGWWYSAALPGERGVTMFMTDATPGAKLQWADWWSGTLTERRFGQCRGAGAIRAHRATSQRTRLEGVEDWLSVGDAALARDPLSSRGLLSALTGASRCAAAVDAALERDRSAAQEYVASLSEEWDRFLAKRAEVYSREDRFGGAFWRRRALPRA